MKKLLKEIIEIAWFWLPILTIVAIFTSYLYYKAHYCKEYTYKTTCSDCVWVKVDNGMSGKYYRWWWDCDHYIYYDCKLTTDTCGCNRIK